MSRVSLGALGLDRGAHLLLQRALRAVAIGEAIHVDGEAPELAVHLRAWCRTQGHTFVDSADEGLTIVRGPAERARWAGAQRAGKADRRQPDAVATHPAACWGLAARGAMLEAGTPAFAFRLEAKDEVWAEDAAQLYTQALANQWDPAKAVDWDTPFSIPDDIEDAVVQVMTYLIENETAALLVPARFVAQLHPHFREIMQLLAIQAADEARHIEVFTRRATLRRDALGLSTAGGQASLQTLVTEPDFSISSLLLSVLGEGSFLSLLWFLVEHAPDPVTRQICTLAAQDEARHVAFGLSHLRHAVRHDPTLASRLAAAVHRRHDALRHTAGLNAEVFDALVLLAAGSWTPAAIAHGWAAVQGLVAEMDGGRRTRLVRIGFGPDEATELSRLHTRNFM